MGGARAQRVRSPPSGGEAGVCGYWLAGSSELQSGRWSVLLHPRGPEPRLGAATAVKVERQTAKSLAARADGNYVRRLLGWGCGKGSQGWSPRRDGAWPNPDGGWGLAALCRMVGELRRERGWAEGRDSVRTRILRLPHLTVGAPKRHSRIINGCILLT